MNSPFLSIIIPAFNEEARIVSTLERVSAFLSGQSYSWELLVVDDGSSDRTAAVAKEWAQTHEETRVETVPHGGKGWAVRNGMLSTTGRYRFMCDADLAMSIEGLPAFLERMCEGYDIVIGSRQIAGARRFDEPIVRHIMGRVFNWSVRLLAVRGFQDTQCGFKCVGGEAADELFALQRTNGFGFDVEFLYLAIKRGFRVLEMPIDWYYQRTSKVRAGADSFLMLRDTIAVRWRDLAGTYKSRPASDAEAAPPDTPVARRAGEEAEGISESGAQVDGLVTVVVPTYNEANNLPELADRVFALDIPNTRLIVVDDNSPDGTADVARELAGRFKGKLDVIRRPAKLGLGTAYIEGFSRALAQESEYVVQMDADLSHPPEYIPALLEGLRRADVVVGSRYVRGGRIDHSWSLKRRLLSQFANFGFRIAAGLKVRDTTSGFKAYRASALRSLALSQLRCSGFGFQAEVAFVCQRQRYRVAEYPIVFTDRARGKSKMSAFIVLEALWRLLLLRWKR